MDSDLYGPPDTECQTQQPIPTFVLDAAPNPTPSPNPEAGNEVGQSIRRRALVPKEQCPMALAAELLGDRWTLLILREACYGVQRYDDMLADLSAPRSMLTNRLNRLVERSILQRYLYQEPGERKRNAYALTQAGRELALPLLALTQWGEDHMLAGEAPVEAVDKTSGDRLRVKLVDKQDEIVSLDRAILSKRIL